MVYRFSIGPMKEKALSIEKELSLPARAEETKKRKIETEIRA